jgi:hypothetical protein
MYFDVKAKYSRLNRYNPCQMGGDHGPGDLGSDAGLRLLEQVPQRLRKKFLIRNGSLCSKEHTTNTEDKADLCVLGKAAC